MDEMLDQRHQADSAKADLPEEIDVAIAAERLRKSTAEADEAQNRTRNRNQLEKAQTGEVEQRTRESEARTREVDHRVRVRWFLAIAGALALILGSSSAVPPPSGSDVAGWWQPPVSHSLAREKKDGVSDELKSQTATGEHLSSSLMQRKAEIAILKRLGKQLGVELEKRRITYHGSVMEVDGIAPDDSVFVEVFARVSPMKSGQLRKVSTDSLKLIALQAIRPDARFILAFADQTALKSLAGWQLAVLEHHKIERRVVEIPASLKQELLAAQANQKKGMAGRAGT